MKIDFQKVNRRQASQLCVRRSKRSRHWISAVGDRQHYITQWALVRAAQLSLARRSLARSRVRNQQSRKEEILRALNLNLNVNATPHQGDLSQTVRELGHKCWRGSKRAQGEPGAVTLKLTDRCCK